jgi:acetyltransferase-like isoleucine patch superfamily enzyme
MGLFRVLIDVVKGWAYLLAFITGGNFIRKARLKRVGRRVKVSPTAFFKHPENIEIGDDTFINHLCSVWASPEGPISIGRDVMLGPGVCLIASNHGIALGQLMRLQAGNDGAIVIGNDCWIGANVTVTAGVTIGDGVVVGANAVVTKDLPPMTICAGVPAKVIRFRS